MTEKTPSLRNKLYRAVKDKDYDQVANLLNDHEDKPEHHFEIGTTLPYVFKQMDMKMIRLYLNYKYYPFTSKEGSLAYSAFRFLAIEMSDTQRHKRNPEEEKVYARGLKILKLFFADERAEARLGEYFRELVMFEINEPAIKLLEEKKIIPQEKDLLTAISVGNDELGSLILAYSDPKVINPKRANLVYEAVENDMTKTLVLLLADPRSKPQAYNSKALYEAVRRKNHEMVKILLSDLRIDASARNNRAILLAIKKKDKISAQLLYTHVKSLLDADIRMKVKSLLKE